MEGKRGKWIANILEYDIEIKPTKLIKGQGLAKLMTETNFEALDINELDNKQEMATPQINQAFLESPCPYELVYGLEVVFPSSLGIPVIKLLQEIQVEPNDIQRRINQTIHLQQTREEVYHRTQVLQEKLKKVLDKRTKAEDFFIGNKVLKWDSRREDKGKHGKFDFLWKGPFTIQAVQGNNTFFLKSLDESNNDEGPVNGRMLKHYHDT
eukprot:PITA_24904